MKTKKPFKSLDSKGLIQIVSLLAESEGFEPSVQFPIRMFSKHVLSATQATLLKNIVLF